MHDDQLAYREHDAVRQAAEAPPKTTHASSCPSLRSSPSLAGGCKRSAADGATGRPRPRIAVVPKGTTHEFWKSVHAGAVKAAQELGRRHRLEGAPQGGRPQGADRPRPELRRAGGGRDRARAAQRQGPGRDPSRRRRRRRSRSSSSTPTSQGDDHASFVATDNDAAGKIAGEELARTRRAGRARNVVVLRYQEGSASTAHREKGFLDALKAHPDVKLVSANQYGGATTETAFATSENLLAAQKASAGGVSGVFAPNESTTFGMLLALRKAGLAGKIHLVGFDASDKLTEALGAGEIDALVVQGPFQMGYLAVKTMAHICAARRSRSGSTPARSSSRRRTSTTPRSRRSSTRT